MFLGLLFFFFNPQKKFSSVVTLVLWKPITTQKIKLKKKKIKGMHDVNKSTTILTLTANIR